MSKKVLSTPENLQVIFEDNHLIVINKRPGDIVQGDKTGDMPLSEVVKLYIKQKYNKPGNVYLGVTHRLDRPTSGIVVFAKNIKSTTKVEQTFCRKRCKKNVLGSSKECSSQRRGNSSSLAHQSPETK